jgi:hypothetical protein
LQHDGFVQDLDSGEFVDADLPNVDFDQPIDPENPGFASLLPALQAVRRGELDMDVLDAYVQGLGPRLDATFQQWESVAAQPLEQMGLEEEQVAQLRGAFAATEGLLQEMDHVLGLIERGAEGDLEEAEQRLSLVHNEIRAALG